MTRLEMALPIKPRSKERPRFRAGSPPFNSPGYREWKGGVRELVERLYSPEILTCRLRVSIEWRFPTEPVGDIDGLVGGLMDAMQPDQQGPLKDAPLEFWLGRVAYLNDSQVKEVGRVLWVPSGAREIFVVLERVEAPDPWTSEKKSRRKVAQPRK